MMLYEIVLQSPVGPFVWSAHATLAAAVRAIRSGDILGREPALKRTSDGAILRGDLWIGQDDEVIGFAW